MISLHSTASGELEPYPIYYRYKRFAVGVWTVRRVIVREFRINRSVNLNSDIEKYCRPSISDKGESIDERNKEEREIRWWKNKKQIVNINDFNCCSRIYTDFTVCFNVTRPIEVSQKRITRDNNRNGVTFRYEKLSMAAGSVWKFH